MINLTDAGSALKTLYLGVIAEQLNNKINPFLAKLEQTSDNVFGKEIKKLVTDGINGGISSNTETGALPMAVGNNYVNMTLELKNFYGKIEISDKAVLASQDSSGAFVNLLNAEMESLVKASKFNFGRMLFGNGSGKLAEVVEYAGNTAYNKIKLDDVSNICAGMVLDFETSGSIPSTQRAKLVTAVNYADKVITINYTPTAAYAVGTDVYVQSSKDKELTGLDAVCGTSESLYGLTRANYNFLNAHRDTVSAAITASKIQAAIDEIEKTSGTTVNYITTSYDVRKKYVDHCTTYCKNIDVMHLDSGYTALSYAGIPLVADRFCPQKSMYILNSDDFKIYQLCDWRWIEGEDGSVLKQSATAPTYTATLVKYADMLCERPWGQAVLTNIDLT